MVKYEAELDAVFMALAHPARRSMLARLGRGEATVGELAAPLDMSLPAVTKHLRMLERAHLVSRGRDAQWRPCTLQPAPLQAASAWIDEQRQLWNARFDRLEAYLQQMPPDPAADAAPASPRPTSTSAPAPAAAPSPRAPRAPRTRKDTPPHGRPRKHP